MRTLPHVRAAFPNGRVWQLPFPSTVRCCEKLSKLESIIIRYYHFKSEGFKK